MPSLGWQELVIVLVIVVIIFGAGKLPELSGALGKSIKEFKANTEDTPPSVEAKASAGPVASANSVPRQARAEEI